VFPRTDEGECLARLLRATGRRLRARAAVRGALWALAAGVALLAALVLLTLALDPGTAARRAALGAFLAIETAVLLLLVARPALRRLSRVYLAERVERARPELDGRLILLAEHATGGRWLDPAVAARVAAEAAEVTRALRPAAVLSGEGTPARPHAALLAGTLVFLVTALVTGDAFFDALARALRPSLGRAASPATAAAKLAPAPEPGAPPAGPRAPTARVEVQSVTIRYPGYTGLAPRIGPGGAVDALRGSTAELEIRATEPVESVALVAPGGAAPAAAAPVQREAGADGTLWRASFRVERSGSYRIVYGLPARGAGAASGTVTCRPDVPPSVSIARDPEEPAAVLVRASDDYGLGAARAVFRVGDVRKVVDLPARGPDLYVRVRAPEALARPGAVLAVRAEAADRREPAPNRVRSGEIRLALAPEAPRSLFAEFAPRRLPSSPDSAGAPPPAGPVGPARPQQRSYDVLSRPDDEPEPPASEPERADPGAGRDEPDEYVAPPGEPAEREPREREKPASEEPGDGTQEEPGGGPGREPPPPPPLTGPGAQPGSRETRPSSPDDENGEGGGEEGEGEDGPGSEGDGPGGIRPEPGSGPQREQPSEEGPRTGEERGVPEHPHDEPVFGEKVATVDEGTTGAPARRPEAARTDWGEAPAPGAAPERPAGEGGALPEAGQLGEGEAPEATPGRPVPAAEARPGRAPAEYADLIGAYRERLRRRR